MSELAFDLSAAVRDCRAVALEDIFDGMLRDSLEKAIAVR